MPRKYPPLSLAELEVILTCWGFEKQKGHGTSHRRWNKVYRGRTFSVSVDEAIDEFDDYLIRMMIYQSGLKPDQFYAGSKSAARKANVTPLTHAR